MKTVGTYVPGNSESETAQVAHDAPTLVLMAGFAGAGKTTLAKRLEYWLGWEVLNKDEFKRQRLAQGEEVESAGWNAFEELFCQIKEKVIQQQKSVIIDTSNENPFIFEKVQEVLETLESRQIQAQFKVILCTATKETRTRRLLKRGSVFSPYVVELPAILDDSELPERFKHLPVDKVFIVNTNPPLGAYDRKVRKHLAPEEEE